MTSSGGASDRYPYLHAAGAGGMLGGPVAALILWQWWPLVLGLLWFLGCAAIAAARDLRRKT